MEQALARDVRVIPVLVDGAAPPQAEQLPATLQTLARRQATRLTHERFGSEADGLVRALEQALPSRLKRSGGWFAQTRNGGTKSADAEIPTPHGSSAKVAKFSDAQVPVAVGSSANARSNLTPTFWWLGITVALGLVTASLPVIYGRKHTPEGPMSLIPGLTVAQLFWALAGATLISLILMVIAFATRNRYPA